IGAGGIDVAAAMGGGAFYLPAPAVVKIELKGRLGAWVSAKDVILEVLRRFGTSGNVGKILEYGGKGVRHLDVPARATIANMGAECGVTTSVFPSDEVTREFLEAQGRGGAWQALEADADAAYADVVTIDLAGVEPLAAAPHSPGNVVPVASLAGTRVDQVLIGSCTNSSYRDLKTVAKILEGRHAAPGVELGIAPGSRQVLAMMAREGHLQTFIAAGARILENACGFCIGNSMSPATNAVSLRTSNRNFEGRSGTRAARVFLVSPETAALAAVHGRVIDPRLQAEIALPRVRPPRAFDIDDGMFVFPPPPEKRDRGAIARGPGIGEVPVNEPLPEELSGVVTIKVGDKITTDHIMPAGARLKHRSNVAAYSAYVFEPVDREFAARAAAERDAGRHNVIVAGESYGQGSSREHAALCPMFLGVKAVVAKSVERIHQANLINFGIVPFVFEKAADYDRLQQGDAVRIAGLRGAVAGDGRAVLRAASGGAEIPVRAALSERQKRIVLAGGLLNTVR
ncbi:MAG: aconitate hydratase, partial [Lentisphaerae bacterium]|nr:aconitate hydratase [Lentisphaerota bacterium]